MSIVELVQTSLSKNFAIVQRRLSSHDARLAQSEATLRQEQTILTSSLSALEQQLIDQNALLTARMQELFRKVQALEEGQLTLRDGSDQANAGVRRVNE